MENTSARLQWIDCAKAVAMAAVATDHCNNLLYTNPAIFKTTAFSVQLFILLSGIVSRKASTKYRYVSAGGGPEIEKHIGAICFGDIFAADLLLPFF